MKTLLISYDLWGPETSQSYEALISTIQSYSQWCRTLESFWFVRTNSDVETVHGSLAPYLDSNDKLLVMDVTGDFWIAQWLPQDIVQWMLPTL